MPSRIDPDRLNTAPKHHEVTMYLLRLCADLKILHNAGQPLRADPSRLAEWSTHMADLQDCEEPIMYYGSHSVHKKGTMFKHADLLLVASSVIGKLELRNIGADFENIPLFEIEELERLAMRLNECRKRTAFY